MPPVTDVRGNELTIRDLKSNRERTVELFEAKPNTRAGGLVWSGDEQHVFLTIAENACLPPDWTQSVLQVDTTSLTIHVLLDRDERRFRTNAMLRPDKVLLTDKDGFEWELDLATAALSKRER